MPRKVKDYEGELPEISPAVVDALVEMLMTDQGMTKPPRKAAAVLALVVELYKRGMEFPPRDIVAAALDTSKYTVDSALSTRIAEGYLAERVEYEEGSVSNRQGVVRLRYIDPSERVRKVVEQAETPKRRKRG